MTGAGGGETFPLDLPRPHPASPMRRPLLALFLLLPALTACANTGDPGSGETQEPALQDETVGRSVEPARIQHPVEGAQEPDGEESAEAQLDEAVEGAGTVEPTSPGPNTPRRPPTWYAIIHLPGPNWRSTSSPFEQPAIDGHVDHYGALAEQGKLALGGPFLDAAPDGTMQGGGMMLLQDVTEAEARAIASSDPAVEAGTLIFQLRTWLVAMQSE